MFNNKQQEIIKHLYGGLLVLAPVGTGKTLTLAERAANAVSNGIAPERVLCLTFTNRATKEMSERIKRRQLLDADKITISTFHALCATMLRLESREIGLPRDFVVYDEVDSIELIQEIEHVGFQEARNIYNQIGVLKVNTDGNLISANGLMWDLFKNLPDRTASIAIEYQRALQLRHALDFQDLVAFTWAMVKENEEIHERWIDRFDFIQVDEVQDTHFSEYRIVHTLAQKSGNLALIGDFDQTIYEWRGSEPRKLIEAFRRDFAPVTLMPLKVNYRSTKRLLGTATTFAKSFNHSTIVCHSSEGAKEGDPIQMIFEGDEKSEGERIGRIITGFYKSDPKIAFNHIGILTRTNQRGAVISQTLAAMNIPHVTVEQYEFFRRQEIKDALAHLKLLLNPYDLGSLLRVLERPAKGIGEVGLRELMTEGKAVGLNLTDMIDQKTLQYGEPFGALLDAIESGSVVVVDVETTGLDLGRDEVIEIAGVKLAAGQASEEFHIYLRNTVPVGASEAVHGHSDSFLEANGIEATEGLESFLSWIKGSLVIGHNVAFDLGIIGVHAGRLGLVAPEFNSFDTLDIAHRFLRLPQYRLADLAQHLKVSQSPTHKALDDARCTAEIILTMIPLLRRDTQLRRTLVQKHGKTFQPLISKFTEWKKRMAFTIPAELLTYILADSGLFEYYQDKPARLANLEQLRGVFISRDDPKLHPQVALQEVVKFCALAKNVDFLSDTDNRVPIITVHQAKGLEFDIVFLAGAVDGEFPSYYAVKDGKLEEEKRVFYVGLTRAKRKLYITGFRRNSRGWTVQPSRFIPMLGRDNLNGDLKATYKSTPYRGD